MPSNIRPKLSRGGSGVAQSMGVDEWGRLEGANLPPSEKLFKTRDLQLPLCEGSFPKSWATLQRIPTCALTSPQAKGGSFGPVVLADSQSDSVKRHLSRRHLSALNLKFDFISDGGCTREEQIALSLKRHLFPHGGREPKAFWICFPTLPPILNIFSNF